MTKPNERAQLARSWDVLEQRLAILRGKPMPGHLSPAERAAQARGRGKRRTPAGLVIGPAGPAPEPAPAVSQPPVEVDVGH